MSVCEMNDCLTIDMPGLEFEETKHVYTLDGIIIPSVSTVMEPLNADKYAGISKATLDNAANKGTAVHDCIENWIKFGFMDIPPEHQSYIDGFMEWWNKNTPKVVGSEIRLYHKILGYGGTCDLLAYIGDKLTLIDYKSTYVLSDMTCRIQLEAYAQALASHGIKVEQKMILHLKKDGKSAQRDYPANDAEAWRVFGSLKCVYDYIQSYK